MYALKIAKVEELSEDYALRTSFPSLCHHHLHCISHGFHVHLSLSRKTYLSSCSKNTHIHNELCLYLESWFITLQEQNYSRAGTWHKGKWTVIIICFSSTLNFIERCFDVKVGSIFILPVQAILKSQKWKLQTAFKISVIIICSEYLPKLYSLIEIAGIDIRYSANIFPKRLTGHLCDKRGE
jgi:hypothetical protein